MKNVFKLKDEALEEAYEYFDRNIDSLPKPQFAFSHYGAGVKSSLVFLRRKAESETLDDYPIFMAIADRIGYDATGREDKQNDLDKILKEYHVCKSDPTVYEGC